MRGTGNPNFRQATRASGVALYPLHTCSSSITTACHLLGSSGGAGGRLEPRERYAPVRLDLGEDEKLVSTDAAESADLLRSEADRSPLTVEQAAGFLKVAKTHRLYALFSVAVVCGLRLGETFGLRWEDSTSILATCVYARSYSVWRRSWCHKPEDGEEPSNAGTPKGVS